MQDAERSEVSGERKKVDNTTKQYSMPYININDREKDRDNIKYDVFWYAGIIKLPSTMRDSMFKERIRLAIQKEFPEARF